ncbi:MAG TPA: hypothetical protein C5S37_10700 [Methanophagales archaeon]|nr:hypothetical protein [Methanophagales archaeon]
MSEVLLKEIYSEVVGIRRKLELLEDAIIPKEKVSEEELFEIQKLKEESVKGEHVEWEELKREHSL